MLTALETEYQHWMGGTRKIFAMKVLLQILQILTDEDFGDPVEGSLCPRENHVEPSRENSKTIGASLRNEFTCLPSWLNG